MHSQHYTTFVQRCCRNSAAKRFKKRVCYFEPASAYFVSASRSSRSSSQAKSGSDECMKECTSGSYSYINMLYLNDGHIASLSRHGHLHHHNWSDHCPLLKPGAQLREQRARRRKCCTLSSNLITDVRPESWRLTNTSSEAESQGAACAC